jgi:hypothetical protein
LLCLILTPYEVVNITHSDSIVDITPSDIILIQNLIFSSESLRLTESWVPVCLPGISDAGYLQLYCNFFEKDLAIVYITQYQEHSYFLEFAEQSRKIYDSFQNEKIYESITNAFEHRDKSITSILRNPSEDLSDEKLIEQLITSNMNVRKRKTVSKKEQPDHFEDAKFVVCKHKQFNQFFTFRFNKYDELIDDEMDILMSYVKLYDIYRSNNILNFSYFQKSERWLQTIVTNENFILFTTFNYFKEYEDVSDILDGILKTIKANENYFFIKLK